MTESTKTDGTDDRTCRLLSAAELSYAIQNDGQLSGYNPNVYDRVGWVEPPKAFVAGIDDINAALVGRNRGDGVILAYRGTLPPVFKGKSFEQDIQILIDWIHDFFVRPVAVPGLPADVRVDENFYGSVQSLWRPVLAEVQQQLAGGGELFVTGHSKGGPLASIAAALLAATEGITPAGVYTLASPRPGNAQFAAFYVETVLNAVRYEYQNDIVPHLPPTPEVADALSGVPLLGPFFKDLAEWDFVAVGSLFFIDWSDQVVDVARLPEWQRLKLEGKRVVKLVELIARGDFGTIAGDHSLAGGYCNVLCGDAFCVS